MCPALCYTLSHLVLTHSWSTGAYAGFACLKVHDSKVAEPGLENNALHHSDFSLTKIKASKGHLTNLVKSGM